MKKILSLKKLFASFKYAFTGFITAWQKEQNMKIHTLAAAIVIIAGILFKISNIEWLFIIISIGLVIGAEILNTSIENLVDFVSEKQSIKAKNTKDTAAAFVLMLSLMALLIGLIIFIPKIGG